jgi:hypothetical protein
MPSTQARSRRIRAILDPNSQLSIEPSQELTLAQFSHIGSSHNLTEFCFIMSKLSN